MKISKKILRSHGHAALFHKLLLKKKNTKSRGSIIMIVIE